MSLAFFEFYVLYLRYISTTWKG